MEIIFWKYYRHIALNVLILSDSKLEPLIWVSSFGNFRRSHRVKSGKYSGCSCLVFCF